MKILRLSLVFCVVVAACVEPPPAIPHVQDVALPHGDMGADAPDVLEDMGATPAVRIEILRTGEAKVIEQDFVYKLARVTDTKTSHVTYVQWTTPHDMPATPHPVFVYTKPYVGIDWTGEVVDEKWAARGSGIHFDDDEPSYTSGSQIAYELGTPLQRVEEGAIPLLNKIPTLMVFGRFYAGGSIQDDLDDMILGLRFLENRADVDPARIAILGGSWGGFEALYAAAYAPESVRPAYGVALFPLSDFAAEWAYTGTFTALTNPSQRDLYTKFFEPYRRRILATIGEASAANFAGFTHADIGAKLSTPFLFVHDDHDTLVPFTMAQDVATSLAEKPVAERGQYLWFRHEDMVDLNVAGPSHGPTPGAFPISIYTLVYANAVLRLLPDEPLVILLGNSEEFVAMMRYLEAQETLGQGLGDFPKTLATVADSRVQIFDTVTSQFVSGPAFVAAGFNEAFGTMHAEAAIQAALLALHGR